MGHIKYFNVAGYFNSINYVHDMKLNEEHGSIFDAVMNENDKQRLKEAIQKSDEDSKKGTLTGVMTLIKVVEDIQDKYGIPDQYKHDLHRHPMEIMLKLICKRPELVKHYGLEKLAEKYRSEIPIKAKQAGVQTTPVKRTITM